MKKKIAVFVINLKRDFEKRKKIEKLLSATDFSFEFSNAVDFKELNHNSFTGYNDYLRNLFYGKSLTIKEIAIFNSHLFIIKTIIKRSLPYALILEDDSIFPHEFEDVVQQIINKRYEWDLIRFIGSKKFSKYKGRKVLKIGNDYYLERLPKLPGGANAYLVSFIGAKKILSQSKKFYSPYDIFLGHTWIKNMNVLYLKPGLVNQYIESQDLDINDPRFIKVKKDIFSLYTYSRLIYKFYESIFKWLHYFTYLPKDYLRFLKEEK